MKKIVIMIQVYKGLCTSPFRANFQSTFLMSMAANFLIFQDMFPRIKTCNYLDTQIQFWTI